MPLKFEDYSLPKLEIPELKLVGVFPDEKKKKNEFGKTAKPKHTYSLRLNKEFSN